LFAQGRQWVPATSEAGNSWRHPATKNDRDSRTVQCHRAGGPAPHHRLRRRQRQEPSTRTAELYLEVIAREIVEDLTAALAEFGAVAAALEFEAR